MLSSISMVRKSLGNVLHFNGIGEGLQYMRMHCSFIHKILISISPEFFFNIVLGKTSDEVQPTGPTTPSKCDQNLVFDAVTTLRGELFFFINR